MSQLDRIEKRIRNIFEKSRVILPGSSHNDQMVKRFSEAIQVLFMNEIPREIRNPRVQFTLNPTTAEQWRSQVQWEKTLADLLLLTAVEFGFHFRTWPDIKIDADPSRSQEEITISLIDVPYPQGGETGVISIESLENAAKTDKEIRKTPTLIIQGDRTIELTLPVINIGRKSTNHIIINDLRISRNHAQLRKIKENYTLFDIGSSGGTFVNSTRIDKHTLRPGDVISLAGYTMIYTIYQPPAEETQKGITSELKILDEEEER